MAGSIDPSDYESLVRYGSQKKDLAALDAYLDGKNPQEARQRRRNSSSVRGQIGVLRQAPMILILKEAIKRERKVIAREQGRIRQQRHRAKKRREASLAQFSAPASLQSS